MLLTTVQAKTQEKIPWERPPLAFEPLPREAMGLDLSPLMKMVASTRRPFIVFDIESTTFVHAHGFGITEIGLVCINIEGTCSVTSTLLRCDLPIHRDVTAITGIRSSDLKGKPTFPQISERLRALFGNAVTAGYYSNTFDVPGIRKECLRYGIAPIDFPKTVDIARLTKHLPGVPDSNKLTNVASRHGIAIEGNAHRALYDALLTTAVAAKIVAEKGHSVLVP